MTNLDLKTKRGLFRFWPLLVLLLLAACRTTPAAGPQPQVTPSVETVLSPTAAPTDLPTPAPTETPVPVPVIEVLPAEPEFLLGVDLSYVNEMDDCGAVYLKDGAPQDAFELFSAYGANLVRARLWHNAEWTDYSDVEDIKRTFRRAKDAGMLTLLDFHYSDNWADPGKQAIPAAWQDLDDEGLEQALYDYTFEVLDELLMEGLIPEYVQIGNETNAGMLKRERGLDWPRDAKLFNAGIRAVRDWSEKWGTGPWPRIILHVAQPDNAGWWFREAKANGLTDFDIIGLSFYPQWSLFTISDLGAHISYLRQTFGKDVMIVETAYPWTLDAAEETADNILNQGVRGYPFSFEGQRQFMIDLSQNMISNGGLGVVYWEPAWVSTQCTTRWGQGSHWENATFFDFKNNNEVHAGIEFLSYPYHNPELIPDGVIEEAYGEAVLTDEKGDHLDDFHLDLLSLHARADETSVYMALTVAGNVYVNDWGNYIIYIDTTEDAQGAEPAEDRRPISIVDPYKPEFRITLGASDRKGTVSGSFELEAWDGTDWQDVTFTGGKAIDVGVPSVFEIQIERSQLGNPEFLNLAVVSVGRGRGHTAGDIMGVNVSPADWNESVQIDVFFRLDLAQ